MTDRIGLNKVNLRKFKEKKNELFRMDLGELIWVRFEIPSPIGTALKLIKVK